MTDAATKTYQVTVIERALAFYDVKAENARTAAENWSDGDFEGRDDEALDTEGPSSVREQQPDGAWRKVPESEWRDEPKIARFEDYEIEPRIRHWEDGDPEKPDHIACDEPEADMWRLYGNRPGRDSVCIGEYGTRALAEDVHAGITGRRYAAPIGRDLAEKPYSVLLLYPEGENDGGTETYYAWVQAADPVAAVAAAQRQALAANDWADRDPAGFTPLLVTEGHHRGEAMSVE